MDVKLLVATLPEGTNLAAWCRRLGITRTTAYQWRARHRARGIAGLEDRSRAPENPFGRNSGETEDAVVAARKELAEEGLDYAPASVQSRRLAQGLDAPPEAPSGPSDAPALERVLAADMAAVACDDAHAARSARALVRRIVDDPWRRELALERLWDAERVLMGCSGPHRHRASVQLAGRCFSLSAVAVVLLPLLPVPSLVLTAGVAAATLVAVVAWGEVCDARAHVPQQLASTAMLPVAPTPFVMPEPALVEILAEFAGGNVGVVDEAAALLDREHYGSPTDLAHARLQATKDAL